MRALAAERNESMILLLSSARHLCFLKGTPFGCGMLALLFAWLGHTSLDIVLHIHLLKTQLTRTHDHVSWWVSE